MPMRLSVPWAAAMLAATVAALGLVGSDALWLVPLGRLVAHGHIPSSIPFATAPSRGWHDVPAGGQLMFWALYRAFGGLRGLVVAQAVASAIAFGALTAGLRRETDDGSALVVAIVVLVGSIPAVVVVGAPLYSLPLFSALLVLLETERYVWLAVPLVAVWGNLHGGVLTGLGVLACYAIFRRRSALPVLAASVLALFLNPELWHTARYYEGVFRSAPAREGQGLWAPLAATPFDLVLVAAALLLVAFATRRVRRWEAVAMLLLAAGTVHVARTGTFLLFVTAYPAARGLRMRAPRPRVVAAAAAVLGVIAVALLAKGPPDPGSSHLARIAARDGRPVLADAILGHQVALAGGRVWLDNPIDAFRRTDQQLYLDWLDGKHAGDAALRHASYVLVQPTSKAGRRAADDPRLRRVAGDANAVLYRVRAAAAPPLPS
jgi:hypothetical protein